MKIDRIDHLVLTVKDIDKTCAFYTKVMGMAIVTFGDDRRALAFGSQKINLHEHRKEPQLKAQNPTPGSADLCFITSMSIPETINHVTSCGVALLVGPVQKIGAQGPILSVYFRDPDMNLIEVSNYIAA
jgi:catechol 2,3-dioxygenase-like lactoylglutathione lyase family enzyme